MHIHTIVAILQSQKGDNMNKYPIGVTPEARINLIEKFDLSDAHYIDWEIIVADPSRLQEFIHGYRSNNWSVDEKYALMVIIVASYEEALKKNREEETIWNEIRSILITDMEIHVETIITWSLKGEEYTQEEIENGDGFLIKKRMIEVYGFCNIQALVDKDRWNSFDT
ncbi:hypothetical protein PAECIP111893_02096 [Paenibacillus plantiphilus]|uniref:Uncharacterized protein n=2 Tax=Paenibacillus plantiphilus TaxID=2905650 RepID=A0ABN8GA26_9BACL|nr:hypothetical protein PAECIP111893_02096 [Paenibacillus plantiphilus]